MNEQTRALARALQQIITVIILLTLVIVFIDLRRVSTGIVPPLMDGEGNIIQGSVAEKVNVKINGMEQGMIIRGKDLRNPVLLFIEESSGLPGFVFNETHATKLEDHFTVVWWEGRGAGLSHDESLDQKSLTLEQYVQDAAAISEYLGARLGQDKLNLLGHGSGSLVGISTAQARPELFHAYIGMSQSAGSRLGAESGTLIYQYLLSKFAALDDQGSLNRLERLATKHDDGTVTFSAESQRDLDALKHRAGNGTMRHMTSRTSGVLMPLARTPAYTLGEKLDIWRSSRFMEGAPFYQEFLATDMVQDHVTLAVPVYFLIGAHDYMNPHSQARRLFDGIRAPVKGFYTFKDSAASPLWEEPEAVIEIMVQDVLLATARLAD